MEIKTSDIKAFFNHCAKQYSRSLTKKCVTHVRSIFEFLIDDDVITKNPARKATMPKTRKPSERFLELLECKALLGAAEGRDYIILRLLLSCALRPSEVFALRLDDVKPGTLRIDEAATPLELKDTKTEESNGFVPMSPMLEMELRAYIRTLGLSGPREFLFPTAVGTPISHENYLDRRLKPIAKLAGLAGVNFQVLRRTVATHMQNHGEVKSAQALLRHRDPETTLKHYQKTIDENVIRAAVSWDASLMTPNMPEKLQ